MTIKYTKPTSKRFQDLTGLKFGMVTVQSFYGIKQRSKPRGSSTNGNSLWECLCECGKNFITQGDCLKRINHISCGCYKNQLVSLRTKTHGLSYRGGHNTPFKSEYTTWVEIRQRCRNPKSTAYKNYGGRGIKICDRWQDFENFFADMGQKPTPNHCIERIDNDGDYTPENCKWATRMEQARNTRKNIYLTIEGVKKPFSQLVSESGVKYMTAFSRYRKGLPIAEVFKV
jgi:hypothetical protein